MLVAALAAPAAHAAPPKPKIAVMEVRAGQGLEPKQASALTAILAADAARAGLDVISQADIAAMLSFQKQRQMLGCTDEGWTPGRSVRWHDETARRRAGPSTRV